MEHPKLYSHQRAIVERAMLEKRMAVFADPGTGKTISMLELQRRRPMRTLVVAPKTVIETAWRNDSEWMGMADQMVYMPARDPKIVRVKRLIAIPPGPCVVAVGFEMFRMLEEEIATHFRPQRLIVDESSRLKNPDSQTSKALIRVADRVEEVFPLSGTPAPNGPHEYWGQLRLIDRSTGGAASNGRYGSPATFHSWAFRYLVPIKEFRPIPGGARHVITGWKLKPGGELDRLLSLRAIVIRKSDCLDLPEKMDRTIRVSLGRDEWSAYLQLEADASVSVSVGEHHEFAVQAVTSKLRQVTGGGFIGENGEYAQIGDSKIEALEELIGDTLAGEPVVIWCEFRADVARVCALMHKMKIDCAIADGDHDSTKAVAQFTAGGVSVLIANSQSIGHGVTLVKCGTKSCGHAIYYSLSWSAERYAQSRDRIHRIGQRCDVTYWHLVAKETIDETIMKALSNKMSVQELVLERLSHGHDERQAGEEGTVRDVPSLPVPQR